MRITHSAIEKARAVIQKAPSQTPAEPTFTKSRAIGMLTAEIDELLHKKNYTLEQTADMLGKAGIPIAASTLKGVLYEANKRVSKQQARQENLDRTA